MPVLKLGFVGSAKTILLCGAIFAAAYIPSYATLEAISQGDIKLPPTNLSLYKPNSLSWEDEVNRFAARLADAYDIDKGKAHKFSGWILEAAYENQQSPDLIASIIMTESSFRTNVRSSAGAVGPVQVRPKYWSDHCGDLNDPLDNIRCGAMVIRKYSDMANGNVKTALKMYNVGPTNVKEKKLVEASDRYVSKIVRHLAMLENPSVVIR